MSGIPHCIVLAKIRAPGCFFLPEICPYLFETAFYMWLPVFSALYSFLNPAYDQGSKHLHERVGCQYCNGPQKLDSTQRGRVHFREESRMTNRRKYDPDFKVGVV
jgi:hypothetical protein